ncbi:hypothetical protein AAFF_G00402060 [Aldrovandia affinis]|uniref:Uncharacterized protein n=1 Tax=Aldrovandia affinis TaxID=143900 RepID=A0AAD7X168_9TELE|nr:hypothetical protein AAFF_G00402060 [Aldrovandia affinis]
MDLALVLSLLHSYTPRQILLLGGDVQKWSLEPVGSERTNPHRRGFSLVGNSTGISSEELQRAAVQYKDVNVQDSPALALLVCSDIPETGRRALLECVRDTQSGDAVIHSHNDVTLDA